MFNHTKFKSNSFKYLLSHQKLQVQCQVDIHSMERRHNQHHLHDFSFFENE